MEELLGVVRYDEISALQLDEWAVFDVVVAEDTAHFRRVEPVGPERSVVDSLRVSDLMEAELHAVTPGLRVDSLSRRRQWLDDEAPPHWQWRVTALEGGTQRLALHVFAVTRVDGRPVARRRTYAAVVEVAVPPGRWLSRLWEAISNNPVASGVVTSLLLTVIGLGAKWARTR
ncbi:hypothetical protein [Rubrivirga sp. IMCC43871]|uniref:hypothetical protein n=1 Tax=Rubrivirga sp. IMCC43871 TaxID=3391575 RepID=UPI00398F977C